MPPTMIRDTIVPIAPDMSSLRRPTLSISRRAGMVETVFTIPYTPVASRDVVFPDKPNCEKMVGA